MGLYAGPISIVALVAAIGMLILRLPLAYAVAGFALSALMLGAERFADYLLFSKAV
jgi:hypothetical protein